MKTYLVIVPYIHHVTFEIEADSAENAIDKVGNGEGAEVDDTIIGASEKLDSYTAEIKKL